MAIKYLFKLIYWAGLFHGFKVFIGLIRMHWRYFLLGRGRGLYKFIPLNTPMKIHIDPASACNFKCFFCPQANPMDLKDAGVPLSFMSLDLFKSIVDGLNDFPRKVDEFVIGNYGEPLLHKDLPEMIRYAKKSKKIREVTLISNGSKLKGEMLVKIACSGLDKIRLSIEAMSDEEYAEVTKTNQKFSDIVDNVKSFYLAVRKYKQKTFIYTKILDTGLNDLQRRKFFEVFSPISDAVSIENLVGVTADAKKMVQDNKKGMTGVSFSKDRKVCPSPFYSLSIHSNGDVGVCCSDWYHKTNVGNFKNKSIKEIWMGESLREFRRAQLTNSWRKIDACAGCEMIYHYPHFEDLDAHSFMILNKI